MEIVYDIVYAEIVVTEDMPRLPKTIRTRIKNAIEHKLVTQPDLFGKPLRRSLSGYRKLRVGDYRIVFRIEGAKVKILVMQHRSVVYDVAGKRV